MAIVPSSLDRDHVVRIAQEGLVDFIKEVFTNFQKDFLQSDTNLSTCSSCTTANVLECPTTGFCSGPKCECYKHDIFVPAKRPNKQCPKGLCNKLMAAIRNAHRSTPTWKNTDARKWCTDALQICKCFMPRSSPGSFDDINLNNMLTIIINNKKFQVYLEMDLQKLNTIRTELRQILSVGQKCGMQLDDNMPRLIEDLTLLLQDPAYLIDDEKAKVAVTKLKQLKFRTLPQQIDDDSKLRVELLGNNDRAENIFPDRGKLHAVNKLREDLDEFKNKTTQQFENEKQERDKLIQSIEAMTVRTVPEKSLPEPSDWDGYIQLCGNGETMFTESLIEKLGLPNNDQLDQLQKMYLQTKAKNTSVLLKTIENRVHTIIISKNVNIRYTWLAYVIGRNGDIQVQLVIEMDNTNDEINLSDIPLYRCSTILHDAFSDEAKIMMTRSDEFDELPTKDINALRKCINKIAHTLMTNHRQLSIINASSVRSKGFNTPDKHRIISETCIVFYVRKKGLIPVGEQAFENLYEGFPVDVREGVFYANMQAGSEIDETLKMGCRIVRKVSSIHGEDRYRAGTLGGFIDHPQYGLCGLTCAHVVLDENEMSILHEKRELCWLDFNADINVYLFRDTPVKIGRLVKAILTTGDESSHGIDAAIFQIERFFPADGAFVNVITQENDTVRFNAGKVYGPSRFSKNLNVFKYGATTGKTVGKFLNHMPFVAVSMQAQVFSENIIHDMHNQIEIKSIDSTLFSKNGDSGSLVMAVGNENDLCCIGIVEGSTSFNTSIVTPAGPILETMNVLSLKSFETDQIRHSVRRLEETTRRLEHSLEQTKNEILSALRDLKKTD